MLHGKLEIKQLLHAAFAWAPDFRVTMTSLTIAGDTGTTEWVIEGTQTGPLPAGPLGELRATGRSFRLRGASILMFQEGRIAKVTDYYDMATFCGSWVPPFQLPSRSGARRLTIASTRRQAAGLQRTDGRVPLPRAMRSVF